MCTADESQAVEC